MQKLFNKNNNISPNVSASYLEALIGGRKRKISLRKTYKENQNGIQKKETNMSLSNKIEYGRKTKAQNTK